MIFPREEWRDIQGYENYEISSTGRVRNKKRKKFLKFQKDKDGYLRTTIFNNGIPKTFFVHRLVAQAFVPNIDPVNKKFVDHINTIRTDNYYKNLCWCDCYENNHNELSVKHHLKAVRSEDFRKKMRERQCSEETRRKMSEAHRKENLSEETLRKMSEANKGRVFSEEHRRKIGEANKKRCGEKSSMFGKHHSEETKRRISESKRCEKHPRSRRVEISKDGVSLGIFPCVLELQRRSEELFGTKLYNSAISAVCQGKYNQHKGFTFRYIDE